MSKSRFNRLILLLFYSLALMLTKYDTLRYN